MAKPKMMTCISRPKHQHSHNHQKNGNKQSAIDSVSQRAAGDLDCDKASNNKQLAIKTLTSQIKGMAVKASGAYKCNTCAHPTPSQTKKGSGAAAEMNGGGGDGGGGSESLRWSGSYKRTTSSSSTGRWGKEMEARLKVLSSASTGGGREVYGSGPASAAASGRVTEPILVVVEETEPKEWVAQVEPGVLITFVSLPRGGNDLKRIRFSRDTFDKTQAQKWWTDNYEKVMELYNVQRLNKNGVPLPTDSPRPEEEREEEDDDEEEEISKMESIENSPDTPPLTEEILQHNLYPEALGTGYSSSDSYDFQQQQQTMQPRELNESSDLVASTSKYSSPMDDPSLLSPTSRDVDIQSEKVSFSNASDMETEWVEEDEPGVYITIRALPGGGRELRRVRFSRERFGEMHARLWWEENRNRINEQYL